MCFHNRGEQLHKTYTREVICGCVFVNGFTIWLCMSLQAHLVQTFISVKLKTKIKQKYEDEDCDGDFQKV